MLNKATYFPVTFKNPHWLMKFFYWVVRKQARPNVFYVQGIISISDLNQFTELNGRYLFDAEIHVMKNGCLCSSNFDKGFFSIKALFIHEGGSVDCDYKGYKGINYA